MNLKHNILKGLGSRQGQQKEKRKKRKKLNKAIEVWMSGTCG
jgi:hypothetical protein